MIRNSTLTTARLVIRPFVASDAPALVALFADPSVAHFVDDGEPLSPAQAELWVMRSAENLQRHGYGTGAVIERASDRLIGWAGYARPEDGPEQIIYGLAADRWRQGFGTEIVTALVDFADRRNMPAVHATVDAANGLSIGLLLKHGFHLIECDHGGEAGCDLYRRDRPG